MPKRTSAADSARIRFVIVPWTATCPVPRARAGAALRRDYPGLSLTMHARRRMGQRSDGARSAAAPTSRGGDIVIATMLFLEDHFRPVLPALRRGANTATRWCAAVGGRGRAADAARQVHHGRRVAGAMALLKRLRGKKARRRSGTGGARSDADAAADCRKLLRFIPGTAQDVRAYFLRCSIGWRAPRTTSRTWCACWSDRYAAGPRAALRGARKRRRRRTIRMSASTIRASRAASASAPSDLPCAPGTTGTRRRPDAAFLRACGQRRPLRRRDRRAGGERPARDSGVHRRPRRAAGDRPVLHARRRAGDRRAGLADRLFAGRRPRLQRR